MDEWNTEHHGNSGLTQSVKDSTISESDCENQMLEFIQKYTIQGKHLDMFCSLQPEEASMPIFASTSSSYVIIS